MGAIVTICLYTFGDVPWLFAALAGTLWPIALVVVLVVLLVGYGIIILKWLAMVAIPLVLLVTTVAIWEAINDKKFRRGRFLPKFMLRKANDCIAADKKIFGPLDPLLLDSVQEPVQHCRSISQRANDVLKEDATPWKGFSTTLAKLALERRMGLQTPVYELSEARESLSAVIGDARWPDWPDAGTTDAQADQKVHEQARQFLCAIGEAWKEYAEKWDNLLAAYNGRAKHTT